MFSWSRLNSHPATFLRFAALFCLVYTGPLCAKEEWLPVPAADMALQAVPGAPDEHALILWRSEDTNDEKSESRHYYRIKILTEEGRKFADVEIPYSKRSRIDEIAARLTRPDGSVTEFNGTVYDKIVIRARGIRVSVKSFTIPEVQPGSVIEYRYRRRWDGDHLPTVWEIQDELFTRHVRFSLKPVRDEPLHYTTHSLPNSISPRQEKDTLQLDADNVPPFTEEEFMPPAAILKPRIEFFYQSLLVNWPILCDYVAKDIDKFAVRKKLENVALQVAPASDPPDQRLRKLYARAQAVRNLSFESARTRVEMKQENLKSNSTAEDVLKHGYGYAQEINLLFLALARAAGFDAQPLFLVTRDSGKFDPGIVSLSRLNGSVVQVRAAGKEYFLDPATRFCPFGLLPWNETASGGIQMKSNVLALPLAQTPQPAASDAIVERTGTLKLAPDGTADGRIQIVFRGQEALHRRLSAIDLDETARGKSLQEEITKWLPSGATIKLDQITGWDASEEPLTVDVSVRIPEFASVTGHRLLLPATLTRSERKQAFTHAARVQPIYFSYPYEEKDSLTVRLDPSLRVESAPTRQKTESAFGAYEISAGQEPGGGLKISRTLSVDKFFIETTAYASVQQFMSSIRRGDEQQSVIQIAH